jgi:hypothetical protein
VVAFVYSLIADDSIPCEAREHGCNSVGEEVVFLGVGAAVCVVFALWYIDARWQVGPTAWARRWRQRRAGARAERERWTPRK